ncbi:hypothetical protein B0H17DRAFT_1222315 [Mycena rosella]|uniref:Uncharacterized protein n=1 Tax=Mycena rosella TaxID=1033263 RepID=A0AAD7AY33_MYCRO|nr:hypothetical protein B0H17DRAFT_1222315 [Mycena rosella]
MAALSVPGAFSREAPAVPKDVAEIPPATSGDSLLASAKSYLPGQDGIQRPMTNTGQAAKAYLPQGLAAYLPASSADSQPDLMPPRPLFAAPTSGSASTNLSTEAQGARSASWLHELFMPPGSAFDATTAPSHSQYAGPDIVPLPAPHGGLEPADPAAPHSSVPAASTAPCNTPDAHSVLEPAGSDVPPPPADDEDASPQRKPKLLQRLKEKMHIRHTRA